MSKKRKRHSFEDRLKYIKMLEEGYSIRHICNHSGFDHNLLSSLWIQYQTEGPSALLKKKYVRADGAFREAVIQDIEDNCLTLSEAVAKHNVSVAQIKKWKKKVSEGGYAALYNVKRMGRPPKDKNMGRPKKKKPEEMTELERLRYENECLRAENALLKKVRALVEEREARLRGTRQKPSKN